MMFSSDPVLPQNKKNFQAPCGEPFSCPKKQQNPPVGDEKKQIFRRKQRLTFDLFTYKIIMIHYAPVRYLRIGQKYLGGN